MLRDRLRRLAALLPLPLFACGATPYWVPAGKVPEIAPAALAARLREPEPPLLLDVRSEGEWRRGHIAGAQHVPITEIEARAQALPGPRSRPVVAICYSAHRSIVAVRVLARAGFTAAQQLQGGMSAWRAAGLPEVRAEAPSRAGVAADPRGRLLPR